MGGAPALEAVAVCHPQPSPLHTTRLFILDIWIFSAACSSLPLCHNSLAAPNSAPLLDAGRQGAGRVGGRPPQQPTLFS